ncbi:MAG TPA: glycoside hydrolase family 31 protein [Ktedonobacteraceae bacterium]|nr:glycoside hydrolase family 31 protein [Ktedonobacteraceae bacterium]
MELAQPTSAHARLFTSAAPPGYQALGQARLLAQDTARVSLRADSATVEVTALAPDLFRVGLFTHGRPVDYRSPAVVEQEWDAGEVRIEERDGVVCVTTSAATARLALDPLRVSFTDHAGRVFAADDPELGMGWFTTPEAIPSLTLPNALGTLGAPVRVYKQHPAGAAYFGCGERTDALNKLGTHQLFWNIDPPPGHTVLQNNLYVSIPFTLVHGEGLTWGLFLDNPTRVEFDLAREDATRSWFGAACGDLIYYVFCGPTPQAVLERYTRLTGRTPLAPLWALGNGQSRFSYESAEEVLRVARTFRERGIPCDTIYLDIDVLDGYRDFTWDRERFPDPAGMLSELRELGFHTVVIVDAGVKVDENYEVYTAGRDLDLYCKTTMGDNYQNAVWPGVCTFPDFTNPQARAWWGEQHRGLLDAGIAGIWTDMNEPGLFLPVHSTLPSDVIHPGGGETRLHIQIHNAYGSLMVQATREGLRQLRPERRPFVITRAGYAGVQRHALVWTGDNSASWEHLAMSLPQVLNLGLSGVAWAGVDIGGFYGDTNGELLARWTEFGIFQPFCRNHSEKQSRRQEPWLFGEPYETVCREMLTLRQRLLPYLYTLFDESNRTGAPVLRPLFWSDPADATASSVDDQAMCGDALLIAPITRPGAEYRHVYLPAGTWFHFWSGERFEGPAHILAHAPLGQPALYVRANTAVPLWPAMSYTGEMPVDELTLLLYPTAGSGQSTLYQDAGDGYEHERGHFARRVISSEMEGNRLRVSLSAAQGNFVPGGQRVSLELRAVASPPASVLRGATSLAWRHDPVHNCLTIDLQELPYDEAVDVLVQF